MYYRVDGSLFTPSGSGSERPSVIPAQTIIRWIDDDRLITRDRGANRP